MISDLNSLIDTALRARRLRRDRHAFLRLLYLECRTNVSVLTAVLDAGPSTVDDEQVVAVAEAIDTSVLESLFVGGALQDAAFSTLANEAFDDDEEQGDPTRGLESVLVRVRTLNKLSSLRQVGLAPQVRLGVRLKNILEAQLKIVKALGQVVK